MGLSSEKEILDLLKEEYLSKYGDPYLLTPLCKGLWILKIAKDSAKIRRLTAKTISYLLLELKEIDMNEKSILRAFASASDKVKTHHEGGKTYYEITAPGRSLLNEEINSEAKVLFFTGENSWTDINKNIQIIIDKLEGDLCIVDPYYGLGTFNILSRFGKRRNIRLLTSILGKKESDDYANYNIELKRFKREFKNTKMRKYKKPEELHDRYIFTKNALVIVGHGIKDLANKESFIVYLPEEDTKGYIKILSRLFESRWKNADLI